MFEDRLAIWQFLLFSPQGFLKGILSLSTTLSLLEKQRRKIGTLNKWALFFYVLYPFWSLLDSFQAPEKSPLKKGLNEKATTKPKKALLIQAGGPDTDSENLMRQAGIS